MSFQSATEAALAYAKLGWYVFPVQPKPSKKPLTAHGFKDSSIDEATIRSWWSKWPDAQVGIDCGSSGIVAVDIDDHDGVDGFISWEFLEMENGLAMCSLAMKTPKGKGVQLFFGDKNKECIRRIAIKPGIDILGFGGYTIVPSPASPERTWAYGDPSIPEILTPIPRWLASIAYGNAEKTETRTSIETSATTYLTNEQVDDIVNALKFIPNDTRENWLKVCFALKSTGAKEQAYNIWTEWSQYNPDGSLQPKFNEADQIKTWKFAKESFSSGKEVTLNSLFRMAIDNGYVAGEPRETQNSVSAIVTKDEKARGDAMPGSIELMDWQDVAELPPIEWQVDGLIPRSSVAVLAGDTESGKSFLAIDLSMRLVHGLKFLGLDVEPGSVLYLAGEGQTGLAARLRAWRLNHKHLGLKDEGRYCLVSSEIPVLSKETMHILPKLVKDVTAFKGHPPSLIVLDTLSQGLDDDENSSSVVSPVIRALMNVSRAFGCTVLINHHLVKMNQKIKKGEAPFTPTRDSIRGSGAITRNVDTVLGLVVKDPDSGMRELCVWKQKDGLKIPPIDMFMVSASTGRTRKKDDSEEISCIMVTNPKGMFDDAETAEDEDDDEDSNADQEMEEMVACISRIMKTCGAVDSPGSRGAMSGNAIVGVSKRSRSYIYAAIKEAARAGKIRNAGTEKSPAWLLVE